MTIRTFLIVFIKLQTKRNENLFYEKNIPIRIHRIRLDERVAGWRWLRPVRHTVSNLNEITRIMKSLRNMNGTLIGCSKNMNQRLFYVIEGSMLYNKVTKLQEGVKA